MIKYITIYIVFILCTELSFAQTSDTIIDNINTKYQQIITEKTTYDTLNTIIKEKSTTDAKIIAYFDGTKIKLIEVVWESESKYNKSEFFFDNEKVFYAFDQNKSLKKTDTYFLKDEKLILWLNEDGQKNDLTLGTNTITSNELIAYADRTKNRVKILYNQKMTDNQYMNAYIVISDTSQNYFELRQKMVELSDQITAKIDTMGRGFNKTKNLICLPENDEDEIYAGDYYPRRYPTETLSLEYLIYYTDGKKPTEGTIAVVTTITDNKGNAEKKLAQIKKYSNNAFILNTWLYMGCMH